LCAGKHVNLGINLRVIILIVINRSRWLCIVEFIS
jgi:hypothetical protein